MSEETKKDSTSKEVTIPCKKCNKKTHRVGANYCGNCGNKLN